METPSSAANTTLTHGLQKRIKEMDCIDATSETATDPNVPFDEILKMG